jgi:hypothetical protein
MKQATALILATLLLVGLFAACGGGSRAEPVTVARYETAAGGQNALDDVPAGWIAFARLDEDNIAEVQGFYYLRDSMGETVAVSDMDLVTVNVMEGVITSVTVNGGRSVSVWLVEKSGLRVLYAEPGDSGEDESLTDLTGEGNLATVPDISVGTTRAGSAATTTRRAATTTRKLQTAGNIATTKPPTVTEDPAIKQIKDIENNPNMSAEERRMALKLLSYKMDENGIFYVEHEPWQKQFGFNQIYDLASPLIQLVYGTIRIKFTYGYVYKLDSSGKVVYDKNGNPTYATDESGNKIQKDWMLQWWKGRYGLVVLGAEFGVYTKPHSQPSEHYYAAVEEEELVMAMDVWQQNFRTGEKKYLFTRGPEKNWWLTGFVPGSFYDANNNNRGKSEIIATVNIQFPDTEMLSLVTAAMERAGFSKGSPGRDNPETYTTSGTQLKFCWQYIDQDA